MTVRKPLLQTEACFLLGYANSKDKLQIYGKCDYQQLKIANTLTSAGKKFS